MTLAIENHSFGAPSRSLRVLASSGVLTHEVGVAIRGVEGVYEAFLDDDDVQVENNEPLGREDKKATIPVRVINQSDGNLLVELPRAVVSGGRRIWVPASEVR